MAKKQRAVERVKRWAEYCRQRKEAERQHRVEVIAEFDAGDPEATLHALADEILEYRRAMRLLVEAIGWAEDLLAAATCAAHVWATRGNRRGNENRFPRRTGFALAARAWRWMRATG